MPEARIERLKKRADFVRLTQSGRKRVTATLILQGLPRTDLTGLSEQAPSRLGFTTSKKLGNAVTRNRIRRRLKAACGEVVAGKAMPGWDYAVIGRPAALDADFAALIRDLGYALRDVHGAAPRGGE